MDHEIDEQDARSTEGGEVKVGDKVWVLCEVTGFDRRTGQVKVSGPYGGNFWTMASECRPVEPASSSEILDSSSDPINPDHYKQGGIECIEAIKAATGDGFIGYVWGNVLKYLWRWPKKGGVDDLKKARWYLDRLIKEVGE
jgi:hypothetical protein